MQQDQGAQNQKAEHLTDNVLSSLKHLQSSIHNDIQKMATLKSVYHETQDKKFLITFVYIMDRMSNQLQRANQMYESIDKQIEQHQECQYLSKQLYFYQNQCLQLKQTLRDRQQQLQAQKTREMMLKNEQAYLQKKLYQQTYKQIKYKSKLDAFMKKRKESASDAIKSNRTFQTRSKSMRLRNKSTQMDDNIYQEVYKTRPRSLRHATSTKPDNRMNKTLPFHNKWSNSLLPNFKDS